MHSIGHLPTVEEVAKSLLEARIVETIIGSSSSSGSGSGSARSNWRCSSDSDCPRFETFIEHFAAIGLQNRSAE